jgi:hypothetical protein
VLENTCAAPRAIGLPEASPKTSPAAFQPLLLPADGPRAFVGVRPCRQVAFGAYAEPRKQLEARNANFFKIALVASDCLLLGARCTDLHCTQAAGVGAAGATARTAARRGRPAADRLLVHLVNALPRMRRHARHRRRRRVRTPPLFHRAAGLQPVLVHLSKNEQGKFSFNPVSVNLMTELAKTTFAIIVLLFLVRRGAAGGERGQRRRWASCAVPWTAAEVGAADATVGAVGIIIIIIIISSSSSSSRWQQLHSLTRPRLPLQGTGRPGRPMYRSVRSFIADARHNKLLAVPALFYAINNYLKVCDCGGIGALPGASLASLRFGHQMVS